MTALERHQPTAPQTTEQHLAEQIGAQQAVTLVRQAIMSLDDLRLAHPDEPEGLARMMQVIRILERDLAALRRNTEADAHRALQGVRSLDIEGLGRIEAKQGRSRVITELDKVDQAIAARAAVDEDTGELDPAHVAAAARAVAMTRDIYSGKVAGLNKTKALGLDLDEITEWKDGKPTIVLPPIPN